MNSRLEALVASGRLHPMRPLDQPLSLQRRDAIARAGEVIVEAVASLLPDAHPAHLEIFEGLLELIQVELKRGERLGFTRLDVACPVDRPEDFQLLEVQAGDPSAMGWSDALADAFEVPATLMEAHRAAFEARTQGRRIAFAVLKDSIVESDHRLLAEHYRRHGWQAQVVDPSAFRFDSERLFAGESQVDAVFRDALDELLLGERRAGGQAVMNAVRAGKVTLMNPFCAALADDKSLLEPLSTPSRWSGEVAQVLARHVPCTRLVSERRVDFEGAEVDLVPFIRGARERLVLKPIDGYGGFDVVLGAFASEAEWNAAVDKACLRPGRYVVQRYHPLPRQTVTLPGGERSEAWVVHSIWFAGAGLIGAFARASQNPIVNVHQGGGLTPVQFQSPFS